MMWHSARRTDCLLRLQPQFPHRLAVAILLTCTVCFYGNDSYAQSPPAASISAEDLALVKAVQAARVATIDKVYGSVVAIYGNDRQGGGSGVLFDPAGYALTNHHVIAAAGDDGWAGLADGKLYRWRVLGTDPGGDVAIIQLLGREQFLTAPVGNSDVVRVGDWAMAIGNPFVLAEDQRPTVTLGIVSGIQRYQAGEGTNTLVYGNCIQVDSSINPGNSGGPLFNLRGEIIGINGRGSFEERGRVNVGLGYAISANQVKTFVPDLLATKVAQHGTLDAQFGNRAGGVICQSLNLNAPAARAGLSLGDRLLKFEGVPITSANQFTNLITTYPAEWPCEIEFDHEGVSKIIHVRLTALPYDLGSPQPNPPPSPNPEDRDPADNMPVPSENDSDGEKPAATPPAEQKQSDSEPKRDAQPGDHGTPPKSQPVRIVPQRVPLVPGKIRFPELNQASCNHILQLWRSELKPPPGALVVEEAMLAGNDEVGKIRLTLGKGRFIFEKHGKDQQTTTGFDGISFWRKLAGEEANVLSFEKAMREPTAGYAFAMALGWQGTLAESVAKLEFEGGDKAKQQIAFRLALRHAEQDPLYVWLSVFNAQGNISVVPLKTGISIHDDEPIPAIVFHDWRDVESTRWPYHKTLTTGFAEKPTLDIETRHVRSIDITDDLFRMH